MEPARKLTAVIHPLQQFRALWKSRSQVPAPVLSGSQVHICRAAHSAASGVIMTNIGHSDRLTGRSAPDSPHVSPVTPDEDLRTVLLNQVSWGAVLAGVVMALVVLLLLNLLGIGVGATTLDLEPTTPGDASPDTFSLTASAWWSLSVIAASLAGGYAAGRLAGRPKESTAGWHGLTAWALTTLIVFYLLLSGVGAIIGGAYRTVVSIAGPVATVTGAAVQTAASRSPDPFAQIEQAIRGVTGGNEAALRDAAVSALRAALTGDPNQAQEARERAAQALAQARNISIDQARTQIQDYEQQYRQALESARRQAVEAAEATAEVAGTASLFAALTLIVGAIAAWIGGWVGAVQPALTRRWAFARETRRQT